MTFYKQTIRFEKFKNRNMYRLKNLLILTIQQFVFACKYRNVSKLSTLMLKRTDMSSKKFCLLSLQVVTKRHQYYGIKTTVLNFPFHLLLYAKNIAFRKIFKSLLFRLVINLVNGTHFRVYKQPPESPTTLTFPLPLHPRQFSLPSPVMSNTMLWSLKSAVSLFILRICHLANNQSQNVGS